MTDALANEHEPAGLGPGGTFASAVRDALDVIGGKWVVAVLTQLSTGSLSYRDILVRLPGIQQSMLTRTLKEMERDGLLEREVLPTAPPRTQYSLTELACSLQPLLAAMAAWAQRHGPYVDAARLHYESTAILRRAYS